VTWDPLALNVLELLTRGHNLYGADHFEAGVADAPEQLRRRAEELDRVGLAGVGPAAPTNLRMAAELRGTAANDRELATALAAARTEQASGRHGTRRVLDDARSDRMPAADTPLGRQEALRRMVTHLRRQRHYLHRSHRSSLLLAQRLRRSAGLRRRHISAGHASSEGALPLSAIRYEKAFSPGHVRQRIIAALDHLGVSEPAARGNWIRGYETLIARESGGRPSVVAPEPATVPGAIQPDGRGLGFARGIAQTIPHTFARYHQPGTSTNIYDPVANICASMNYVIHRYGVNPTGENLTSVVQQTDARRPPKGY
jgi:hypothetical protein